MADGKLTGTQQLRVLRNLSQQAAAALLGVSARSLRDWVHAPRNDDGTYDAAELARWHFGRLEPPEIDIGDDDYERLLTVVEHAERSDASVRVAFDTLTELRDRYGPGVLVAFARLKLERWRELGEVAADWESPEAVRQQEEYERQQRTRRAALDGLRIVTVCGKCDRVRRGRRWVRADPPTGYVQLDGRCPDCE